MSENVRQYTAAFLLLFLFLLMIPTVSYGAEGASPEGSGASSSPASYVFPAGTSVESLTEQLAPQGAGHILKVLKPDGGIRGSGAIETGDLVEVLDETGQVLSCVAASVESSSSSPSSSQSGSSFSLWNMDEDGLAVFDAGTTVESLQDKLDVENGAGCQLKVKSRAGRICGSGYLCTGDTLSILDSGGKTLESTKTVVPGDLTRCGVPTPEACSLLYSHLTRRSELTGDLLDAADLNRDGAVDTSDLLLLKKAARDFD